MSDRETTNPKSGGGERREEILDVAMRLFALKGYEQTSINDLLDEALIAKGTFYHYFKSKEDLLDGVVDKITEQITEQIRAMVDDPSMNALEKINLIFDISRSYKQARKELMRAFMNLMYRKENVVLRQKVRQAGIDQIAPQISRVLVQGCQERVFDLPHPAETGELIMGMMSALPELMGELALGLKERPGDLEIIYRQLEFFELALQRMLKAPDKSIKLVDREFIRNILLD